MSLKGFFRHFRNPCHLPCTGCPKTMYTHNINIPYYNVLTFCMLKHVTGVTICSVTSWTIIYWIERIQRVRYSLMVYWFFISRDISWLFLRLWEHRMTYRSCFSLRGLYITPCELSCVLFLDWTYIASTVIIRELPRYVVWIVVSYCVNNIYPVRAPKFFLSNGRYRRYSGGEEYWFFYLAQNITNTASQVYHIKGRNIWQYFAGFCPVYCSFINTNTCLRRT